MKWNILIFVSILQIKEEEEEEEEEDRVSNSSNIDGKNIFEINTK